MAVILIIILILLLIYGVICIANPEWIWKITESRKTSGGGPSDVFLKQLRHSGILCVITSILLLIGLGITLSRGI